MGNVTAQYKDFFANHKPQKADKIRAAFLEAGITSSFEQETIRGEMKIKAAFAIVANEHLRQVNASSTDKYGGKTIELACRCIYAIERGLRMSVSDFCARSQVAPDMLWRDQEGKLHSMECKIHCGALAYGKDSADTLRALEQFSQDEKLILWAYDVPEGFDFTALDALDVFRYDLGYVVARKCDLFNAFVSYNTKKPFTWFHYTKGGRQLNIQSYKNSSKKLAWIDELDHAISLDLFELMGNGTKIKKW